jgi:spore coat polysaccharide biosynthesis protein SpsF
VTVGVLVTARMTSQRLPRKPLLTVDGQPMLGVLLTRIRREFEAEIASGVVKVVIATSEEPQNRELQARFGGEVAVFAGSPANIPLRHLQAARAHGLTGLVAVDGDDILCSVHGMRRLYRRLAQGASYVRTSELPFGMNSMGYSTRYLERSLNGHAEQVLETGWGWIFSGDAEVEPMRCAGHDDPRLRFTLDYPADFDFFAATLRALGADVDRASDQTIVATVIDNEIYRVNQAVAEEYWENFRSKRSAEMENAATARPCGG